MDALRRAPARVWTWWIEPVARGRVAALRVAVYGFVLVDVWILGRWVAPHGFVPAELFAPFALARAAGFPPPTPDMILVLQIVLTTGAVVAAAGKAPRTTGAVVALAYLAWLTVAFGYGKVDHDRFAFLVALAVLPTAGRARFGEPSPDPRCGWAIRSIQVAVVATYVLSVASKLRTGGIEWLWSATLMRVAHRRGTWVVDPFLDDPSIFVAAQVAIVIFELATIGLLAGGRWRRRMVVAAAGFHAFTWTTIRIMFWPHVVCLLAFVPLERSPIPLPRRGKGPLRHVRAGEVSAG